MRDSIFNRQGTCLLRIRRFVRRRISELVQWEQMTSDETGTLVIFSRWIHCTWVLIFNVSPHFFTRVFVRLFYYYFYRSIKRNLSGRIFVEILFMRSFRIYVGKENGDASNVQSTKESQTSGIA